MVKRIFCLLSDSTACHGWRTSAKKWPLSQLDSRCIPHANTFMRMSTSDNLSSCRLLVLQWLKSHTLIIISSNCSDFLHQYPSPRILISSLTNLYYPQTSSGSMCRSLNKKSKYYSILQTFWAYTEHAGKTLSVYHYVWHSIIWYLIPVIYLPEREHIVADCGLLWLQIFHPLPPHSTHTAST